MLKTTTITAFLNEKLNLLGGKDSDKYTFNIFNESGSVKGPISSTNIQGQVNRLSAIISPQTGYREDTAAFNLDLLVSCMQGANFHIIAVTGILDALIEEINGTYLDMDGGRAKIIIDGGVVQSSIAQNGGMGDCVKLSVNINVQWTPDITESTEELGKDQIQIKLMKRTPYGNRIIDLAEPSVEVLKLISTIIGWQHDYVSAVLKIKLPAMFVAEHNYIEITEYGGQRTRWFILQRDYIEPNIWVYNLRRDLIREHWNSISNANCEIERGYLNSSNPLYYKSEGISGNLTLGKRNKLLDSNIMLAYIKTFQLQNNNGSAIPEGHWKVQGGIPSYNNAPIIPGGAIPSSIDIVDGTYRNSPNGNLNLRVMWWTSSNGMFPGTIKYPNMEGAADCNYYGWLLTDDGKPCGTDLNGVPTLSAMEKMSRSIPGLISYINEKQSLDILRVIPDWMKATGGFGDNNTNAFPDSYECVVNAGTVKNPQYYQLIFKDNIITAKQSISANDEKEIDNFIEKTGQAWGKIDNTVAFAQPDTVEGSITYHSYTITKQLLSNTPPEAEEACYTDIKATSTQITSGAYSYNIFAFKVFDDGKGFLGDYKDTAQANSGQLIFSALMGTGKGRPIAIGTGEIPSLAGQVIDMQMCPFNEEAIFQVVDESRPIYRGNGAETGENQVKVGEYYILNSQDVEHWVNYDLSDWNSRGNKKSRNDLSQMRLVCPNNSSMATLNPDIMTNTNIIRFKMNGTLYPYKPIYKVTPVAENSIIYAGQDARDNMLVLGGDFSATQVSIGWSDYLIGNKNVEEAQQASIANQTMNQQLQYDFQKKSIEKQGNISMMSSVLGLMGGMAGFSMGNPVMGALGILGGVGGVMGTSTNMQLQREGLQISQNVFNNNIALNQKLFNLQMGNIKAWPNTIHKITSGSFDNDYSVIIEEYYSTPLEYEQYDKAIRKTGMSVGCMGKISDYVNPDYFVFAQIIESDINDFHQLDEINRELQNGLKIRNLRES